jgi:hypothetical protein
MKKFLGLCLLALPLLAIPSRCLAWGCGDGSCHEHRLWWCPCSWQQAPFPWYLYWPAGADEIGPPQAAGFPFWPNPGITGELMPNYGMPTVPLPDYQTGYQPAGYFGGAAPYYWRDR